MSAQTWSRVEEKDIVKKGDRYVSPSQFAAFKVDQKAIKDVLWTAPLEGRMDIMESECLLYVALPDGSVNRFKMMEYNIMEPALKAQFPEIRTFYGLSVTNPHRSIIADFTSNGFKAMISEAGKSKVFIDNYQFGDNEIKVVYYKHFNSRNENWFCGVKGNERADNTNGDFQGRSMIGNCELREYRMAISTTGEYTDFHVPGNVPPALPDSNATNLALVHSAVVTSLNRVNGVFMEDFAIRGILVANNNTLYFFNPATDGFTNSNGSTLLNENQTKQQTRIGNANYDFGHIFSTGGGGVAQLGSVCNSSGKSRGVTGSAAPIGDPFDIDYVAHEMGHQLNGNHTQNNNCQRNSATAMEPGSASSIMGYAGICTPNVQNNSDAYFHAINVQETKLFLANVSTGGSCGTVMSSFVNTPPVITAQPNYRIPKSTPFALTLNATDPQGNPIKYVWDQMDNAVATMPPVSTNTGGPTFRSISPSTSPTRYFPPLANILNGTSDQWYVLPSVARTMNFRGVARDFTGLAGCNSEINVQVVTDGVAGPFEVTSQADESTWDVGSTQTITWNVAGTTGNGINCQLVDILMSTDGGNTYPISLASSVFNSGNKIINVPSNTTTTGRIMVKSVGNVFFDVNDAAITVQSATPSYGIAITPYFQTLCLGQSQIYNVNIISYGGYTTPVQLSINNIAGLTSSFGSTLVTPGSSTTLTITNNGAIGGILTMLISGVSGSINKTMDFSIYSGNTAPGPTLSSPINNATGVALRPTINWVPDPFATSYDLQLSRRPDFGSIALSVNVTNNTHTPSLDLNGFADYYWRVRLVNNCGLAGTWSPSFKFTTTSCQTYMSTNVPLPLVDNGTVNSLLNISDKGIINDLDVVRLIGTHTFVDDLQFTLFSSAQITPLTAVNVLIWNRPCTSEDDFNINFDQDVAAGTWPCPPTNGGTYRPSTSINTYDTRQISGQWRMQIADVKAGDGGSLTSWGIRTCFNITAPNVYCRKVVDSDAPRGAGSLFAAMACAVDGDTIKFAPNFVNDTIMLFTDNIVTSKRLFIQGNLANNIHVMSTSTLPTIQSSAPNTGEGLKIDGLHIHSSLSTTAGAIENTGLLTLQNVTLYKDGNTAPATILNSAATGIINTLSGTTTVKP
jgi:subtilisin-like proprotein convertase family protein